MLLQLFEAEQHICSSPAIVVGLAAEELVVSVILVRELEAGGVGESGRGSMMITRWCEEEGRRRRATMVVMVMMVRDAEHGGEEDGGRERGKYG